MTDSNATTPYRSIELTEEEFDEQFPLILNQLNPNAGWSFGDEQGCLFETYGDELEFVRTQDPRSIWTLVDDDDGHPLICSGFHRVNRIGYFVSRVPVPENTDYFVPIEPLDGQDFIAEEVQP